MAYQAPATNSNTAHIALTLNRTDTIITYTTIAIKIPTFFPFSKVYIYYTGISEKFKIIFLQLL